MSLPIKPVFLRTTLWASIFVQCAVMGLMGCKKSEPRPLVVARVAGQDITQKAFDEQVQRNLRRYSRQVSELSANTRQRIEEAVLRRMIDDMIIEARAQSQNVRVSPEELVDHIKQHRARFRNEQAFHDYLERSNNTEADLQEDLRKTLLRDRVVDKLIGDILISDAEVVHYYQENISHFQEPEKIHAHRIMVPVAKSAGAKQMAAAHREIERLWRLATLAHTDFAALAKKSSRGPEALRNGDVGTVPLGRLPDLDIAMQKGLKVGEVSPVIELDTSLSFFLLDDMSPRQQKPLNDVTQSIRAALIVRQKNERRQDVLRDLAADTKVEILMPPVQAAHEVEHIGANQVDSAAL